ncbi:MAG: rRNA adenine N-6-methyltransferase family protein [Nanoarchaeota archaeon]
MKPILIREFIRDKRVASIKSSSRFVAKQICDMINFNKNLVIIEYGPGNGVITKEILKRMNKDSRLLVIETNEKFCIFLSKIKDDRLIVINNEAGNVKEILNKSNVNGVDYIISGIPFSMIKNNVQEKILSETKNILNENGSFIVYQIKAEIERNLRKYFSNIKKHREIRNIPPLVIFECKK